jgi:hypothetical protein
MTLLLAMIAALSLAVAVGCLGVAAHARRQNRRVQRRNRYLRADLTDLTEANEELQRRLKAAEAGDMTGALPVIRAPRVVLGSMPTTDDPDDDLPPPPPPVAMVRTERRPEDLMAIQFPPPDPTRLVPAVLAAGEPRWTGDDE